MAYCNEHILVKAFGPSHVAATLPCNAWSCPECAAVRRGKLIRDAKRGRPRLFITLTLRPSSASSPAAGARILARCWRIIRKRAMRRHGRKTLPFLAVFEQHKSGWPHLHLLARTGYLSQKWLSEQMNQLADSPVCYVTLVKGADKIAHYCAKYVGKQPFHFGTAKRYWSSRDYYVVPPSNRRASYAEPDSVTYVRQTMFAWIRGMMRAGLTVTPLAGGHYLAYPPGTSGQAPP